MNVWLVHCVGGVGALYLLFVFVKMSSLSDIIMLTKQVAEVQITHRAIITSLEASECSGGSLLF
jgi:hypothetical protein